MHRQLKDSLLVLRLNKLGYLPPAVYATELLTEKKIPVIVYEFGRKEKADCFKTLAGYYRLHPSETWTRYFPRKFHARLILWITLYRLGWAFLRGFRPKLIIAHGLQEQYLAWRLKRWFKVPYVVHVHEIYDRNETVGLNRFLFDREARILPQADFLIFPEVEREHLYRRRYHYTIPTFFVFNCPRVHHHITRKFDVREYLKIPKDSIVMIYIGGLGEMNAIEESVRSIVYHPQVHLILAGWAVPEFRSHLESVIQRRHVKDRVHFASLSTDKWDWLQSCDIGYCIYQPSHLRNRHAATASNKLMEYLAMGLPVITTNEGGFGELVHKFHVGIAIKSVNEFEIADAIGKLIRNPHLRHRMGRRGRDLHLRQFNYEYQFRKVIQEFQHYFMPYHAHSFPHHPHAHPNAPAEHARRAQK